MKNNKEINQQVRNTAVDKKGRPVVHLDERKSIYNSVDEALNSIPITNRNVGLTVPIYNGIRLIEYWWDKGIKNSDLVKKFDTNDIVVINSTLKYLEDKIDSIPNIRFKLVESLPDVGEDNIIYMILSPTPTERNQYDEYIWLSSKQRYERWGSIDTEGNIIVNNAFTFNKNHFNIVEEYGIKNVSLKCNLLDVTSEGFDIYRLAVGGYDNERLIRLSRYNNISEEMSSYGGRLILNGKKTTTLGGTISYSSNLNNIDLTFNAITDSETYGSILDCDKLKINDNISDITITRNEIKLTVHDNVKIKLNEDETIINTNECLINTADCFITVEDEHGFNISVSNSYGIRAKEISDEHCVVIYNGKGSTIKVKPTSINFDTTNFYTPNLYLNNVQGNVNKGFIPYYIDSYGITLVGIKSTCDLWLENNSFNIKHDSNHSISKFTLNDIKYRKSTTPTSNGSSIISWYEGTNNYPELKLGWNQELQFKENRIDLIAFGQNSYITHSQIHLSHGNANCYIYNNGECGFYTSIGSNINILSNGGIKLDYVGTDEIYIVKNETGYVNGVNLKSNNIKLGLKSYYDNSYIRLYYDDSSLEEIFEVRSSYFYFKDYSNNDIIRIDSDNDIHIYPGNYFNIIGSSDVFFYFGCDNDIKVHASANNYFNMDSTKVYVKNSGIIFYDSLNFEENLGKVGLSIAQGKDHYGNPVTQVISFKLNDNLSVTFNSSGVTYYDGTNSYTKTWAQLLS